MEWLDVEIPWECRVTTCIIESIQKYLQEGVSMKDLKTFLGHNFTLIRIQYTPFKVCVDEVQLTYALTLECLFICLFLFLLVFGFFVLCPFQRIASRSRSKAAHGYEI